MKKIRRAAMILTLAGASGGAFATPCDQAIIIYSSGGIFTPLSAHSECFAGGWTNVINQINGTSFQQAMANSKALEGRWSSDAPGPRASVVMRGMAAGGAVGKWNLWGNVANNNNRQNYLSDNGGTTNNDSDVLTGTIGVDYLISPGFVIGVSAAFDKGDTTGTNTNSPDINKSDTDGWTLAPYIGWQIDRNWSLDASLGWGSGKMKSNANTAADSDRWFGAANLNYETWRGNWQFAGKASLLHGVEDYDNMKVAGASFANTAAENTIDQFRLGLQVGYWMNGFLPYGQIGYTTDFTRKTTQIGAPSDPIGDDAWYWGLGANFFSLPGKVHGGIAYRQEEGRNNQKNWNLMLNVGFRF